jgi:MFS family permease
VGDGGCAVPTRFVRETRRGHAALRTVEALPPYESENKIGNEPTTNPEGNAMQQDTPGIMPAKGWRLLLRREWILPLAILLGGVLLQSMNVLMLATVLPSIVGELGGVHMLSWPTTAFLASSIVAASSAGMIAAWIGPRLTYCLGVTIFGCGALFCSLAPTMDFIVAGRLIQGFGGGLEVAVAYVLVRGTFPEPLWARVIALMSTSWSMSVLVGPLVGGMFASFGHWRAAFVMTTAVATVLALSAFVLLPRAIVPRVTPRVPLGRLALICAAIAAMSAAAIVTAPLAQAALIAIAIASLALMLRLNRTAATALLPTDAFSLRTPTGVGLWLALLLCISFSPLQIYLPMFLQHFQGLDPLVAGFAVASASMGWTMASLATAGAARPWPQRLMVAGPATMIVSLTTLALLTSNSATAVLIPAIVLLGIGMGQCWPFVAHNIMSNAKPGEEAVAAASVPTIQQMGFALGAAAAGFVANLSGIADGLSDAGMASAAFWVPGSFVVFASAACLAALRLQQLRKPAA